MDYKFFANLTAEIGDIPPDSILSRTLHRDDRSRLVLFGFAPGQELSEHTSIHPAILFFVSGEADLTLGDDQLQAGPGTWVNMQPNLAHSVRAKTPVVMALVMLEK
jgi:quercetin dioxygenase-like cupin family protein